jgi:protein-disulfide isomerase
MNAGEGGLALGRYRIGERCAGTADLAVFDAVDPRRPQIRVRLVVIPASLAANAPRVVEQTRRYALGTPELPTAAGAGQLTLPGAESRFALAFELGTGKTLDELAVSAQAADARRALRVILSAARALALLHDQGIGHGLVLPALIAVDAEDRVVLGGYGVAQLAEPARAEPQADGAALARLARDWLKRLLPAELADRTEIALRLDQAPNDVVQWTHALAAAVHAELAKLDQPTQDAKHTPPVPEVSPLEAPPADLSRTPPAVVVASRPPPAAPYTPAGHRSSRAGSWAIGAALGLALLLLVGVVLGLFARTILVSKRGNAPAASGAASVAAPTGPTAVPKAVPTVPPAPAQPGPVDPVTPGTEPQAPQARVPRGAVRRGVEAPASDAEAALPVSPTTPAKAAPDALVTVVMFGDLECPHTRSAYQTLNELERLFPGELRIAWRHRPLREHGHARDAAIFAAALHSEDGPTAFWRLVGDVSGSDDAASREFLDRWASRQERAFSGFQAPTDTAAGAARVDEDLALAGRFGVRDTPTLFINGLRVRGDRPLEELRGIVARELRNARALVGAGVSPSFIYTTRVTKNLIGIGPEVIERTCPPPEKSPRRGSDRALVTMVVFSDYECPFCRRVHPALKRLEARYKSELAIVWKNLPLAQHPNAASAARLALGARAAGGDASFWLVHDRLFEAESPLDSATLESVARSAGIDAGPLMAAVRRGDHQAEIDGDVALAKRLGVTGTPTIFVNGRRVGGAQPFSSFESLVREELSTAQRMADRGVKRERLYATLCGESE